MLRDLFKARGQEYAAKAPAARADISLQVVLWALWTLAVAAVGYINWHADVVAQRPINVLGLVIHCVLMGVIGLVVMTLIEMRLEPERFLG